MYWGIAWHQLWVCWLYTTFRCKDNWRYIDMYIYGNFKFFNIWSGIGHRDRSPVNSPHKGQWRRAMMFSLICAWMNGWVNNGEAVDSAHYGVTVMQRDCFPNYWPFVIYIDRSSVASHYKGPVMRNFNVAIAACRNKLLNKRLIYRYF